ncbi:MAG: hypothetical protein H0V26_15065 [Solirubrobacterales bacterium]|nr:hypothetical protein [Solirubrobacterales bacterium]
MKTAQAHRDTWLLDINASFGVAGSAGGAFDRVSVLVDADRALYDAKAQGRDPVVVAGAMPALIA